MSFLRPWRLPAPELHLFRRTVAIADQQKHSELIEQPPQPAIRNR